MDEAGLFARRTPLSRAVLTLPGGVCLLGSNWEGLDLLFPERQEQRRDHENELTYTWAHYWAGPAIPRKRGLSVCYPGYEERLLAAVNSHVAFPGAKGSLKTRLISHRSSLRSGGC